MSNLGRDLLVTVVVLAAAVSPAAPDPGTVKLGDAVPAIIRATDIERIKRVLGLDHFLIPAAVRLGATEGREAIVAEPLSAAALRRLADACEGGGPCPDPFGFVATRVRIVRLVAGGVDTLAVVESEPRGPRGRMTDMKTLGLTGAVVGWNGVAEAADGHVALRLVPLTAMEDDAPLGIGLAEPLYIRYDTKADRFRVYDCSGDRPVCDFVEEPGD